MLFVCLHKFHLYLILAFSFITSHNTCVFLDVNMWWFTCENLLMSVELKLLFSCIFKCEFEVGYYSAKEVSCHSILEQDCAEGISVYALLKVKSVLDLHNDANLFASCARISMHFKCVRCSGNSLFYPNLAYRVFLVCLETFFFTQLSQNCKIKNSDIFFSPLETEVFYQVLSYCITSNHLAQPLLVLIPTVNLQCCRSWAFS